MISSREIAIEQQESEMEELQGDEDLAYCTSCHSYQPTDEVRALFGGEDVCLSCID